MATDQNLNFNKPFNVADFLAGGSGVNNQPAQESGIGSQILSGAGEILSNPNTQRFLAELGTEIDPEGAGGIIGRPTSSAVQRGALAELAGQGNRVKIGPDGSIDITPQQQKEETGATQESALAGETKTPAQQTQQSQSFDFDTTFDSVLDDMIGGL